MTAYYVRSGAGGAANGTSWANAYTKLATAFATHAAGDIYYVSEDHAETTASSVTLTCNGTINAPTFIICADHAGSVPPVAADLRATATIASTPNNNITFQGCGHYNGISFRSGSGAASSANIIILDNSNDWHRFDNCDFQLLITAGASSMYIGCGPSLNLTGTYVELNNTTFKFSATSHLFRFGGGLVKWRNTPSALSGTLPSSNLFIPVANGGVVECNGVDLSAFSGNIVSTGSSFTDFIFRFIDCKLHASATKTNGAFTGLGAIGIDFLRCNSSGVNYSIYNQRYGGTLTDETTIVRTGGASDATTPIAWKVVTTSGSSYSAPFECPPIAIWNDTTGSSKTATIQGIWGGGAVPNDDEIYVELEYLGDASSPQASFVNDGKVSILSTAAGQTAGSGTWGGSTTKFSLDVSFTAQQKGWIYARVKCAKASSTFYIDPLITLT